MTQMVPRERGKICPGAQGYVRNEWYAIAFSHEVDGETPLRRQCMDMPLVLFRRPDGGAAALFDRCPHRAVPLSLGRLVEDTIECPYHGMRFGSDGRCTLIPTQSMIPSSVRTRSFAVAERMKFIWVWMGDRDDADESLVPDYPDAFCAGTGWQHSEYFVMEIKANYSLLFENLLDTSHISYLHVGGIDGGLMATAPYTVAAQDRIVSLERVLERDQAMTGTAKLFSISNGTVFSRKLTTRSLVPNLHVVRNEIGFPDDPDRAANIRINIMPITPVSVNRLYQFVSISTSYAVDVTEELKNQLWGVFRQDAEVLEAIQDGYDVLGPDLNEISVKADAAAIVARRKIAEMSDAT